MLPNVLDPTRLFIAKSPNAKAGHSLSSPIFGDGPKTGYVSAPLPDGWGVPIENELTQPFADFIPQGPIQTLMALLSVTGGSLAQGYVVRKFFSSTNIPDISLDLSFVTYNNAFDDVLAQVYWLYAWSAPALAESKSINATGAKLGTALLGATETAVNTVSSVLGSTFQVPTGTPVTAQEVGDIVNWLDGPPEVHLLLGNAYHLDGLIITAMEPKFSNNLDYNGVPMQCDVSLTLSLREPFTLGSVQRDYAQQFTGRG